MTELKRTLGPIMIWGLGVGYVISGMYFGWNLGLPIGGPYGMLAATALVTVLYTTFVLGYAELACALPRAGGAFVYTSRAFGPHIGLIGGLAQLAEYVFAPPAVAFAIGSYVNTLYPDIPVYWVAVASFVAFTAINMWGVKLSASFELIVTIIAVVELLVFGFVVLPNFSWEKFSLDALPNGTGGIFAALPFAMWFYLAIEGIANVAEEARDPQRDLPRGFLWAMVTLVLLMLITLFGAVGVDGWRSVVYPPGSETASDSPLPLAISHVVTRDNPLFALLTGIGLIGLIASFHGIIIIGGRAMLELGRVRYLPAAVGYIHPTRRTPMVALAVNFVIGIIALSTGRAADVIYLAVLGALVLYVLSSAAVIALRMKEPQLERSYRAPGYPFTPAIALVLALVCLVAMVWSQPRISLLFAGILSGGWLLFVLFVPQNKRTTFHA